MLAPNQSMNEKVKITPNPPNTISANILLYFPPMFIRIFLFQDWDCILRAFVICFLLRTTYFGTVFRYRYV